MATRKARLKRAARKLPKGALLTERYAYADGRHPVHVYLSGLAEDSARVTGAALDSIADMLSAGKLTAEDLAWHQVRSEHVSALRGRLQKLYAPTTARRYLAALRAVLREAWRLELVDLETIERALDVPTIRGSREPRGRAITPEELRAIFEACAADENRTAGARDAAALALLYGCGLRRAEVAALELEQLDVAAQALRIHGKGNKEREVFVPAGAWRALEDWLAIRGAAPGTLFYQLVKNGGMRPAGINAPRLYAIVTKRHRAAGVEPFTPHDLRRSYISDLLDEGVDIATIARQVGHANVQTTARYDRRKARSQKAAAARVRVPYGSS